MQRGVSRGESRSYNHTPSKREKYDIYTPRKRYVKEQEGLNNYNCLTFGEHQPLSPFTSKEEPSNRYTFRNLSASRREKNRNDEEQLPTNLVTKDI